MVHEAAEPVCVARNPANEVPAVAPARGGHAPLVDETGLEERVGSTHDVGEGLVSVAALDARGEILPERSRSMEVDRGNHVPGRSEELWVPSVMEKIPGDPVRPAVNDVDQRPLLLRVESGGKRDEHLDSASIGPLELDLADFAECDLG